MSFCAITAVQDEGCRERAVDGIAHAALGRGRAGGGASRAHEGVRALGGEEETPVEFPPKCAAHIHGLEVVVVRRAAGLALVMRGFGT